MITRHHIALALICALIACSSFIFSDPLLGVIVCTGTCLGAVLPDIHMSRPRHLSFRTLAWIVVQVPRRLCAPFMCRIYARFGYPIVDPSDKRLTHSIPGVLFIVTFAGILLYVPVDLVNSPCAGFVTVFLGGILLGLGLHLAEDLCTRKGIFPFFPFSMQKIAGSIRPCDRADPRITCNHVQHCSVLIIILWLESTEIVTHFLFLPVSITGIATCLGIMMYSSAITVRQDSVQAGMIAVSSPAQSPERL